MAEAQQLDAGARGRGLHEIHFGIEGRETDLLKLFMRFGQVAFSPEGLEVICNALGEAGLPSLTELKCKGCDMPPEAAAGLCKLLSKCPRLQKIDFVSNARFFNADSIEVLRRGLGDEGQPQLTELDLSRCDLPSEAAGALGHLLAGCPQLTKLDLSGNTRLFSTGDLHDLYEVIDREAGLTCLQELSVRHCEVTPQAAGFLGRVLSKCPRLSRLHLAFNGSLFSPLSPKAPLGLERLAAGIGDDGLPCVEEVTFECCDASAEAAVGLGQLCARFPKLKRIGFQDNKRLFSPQGFQEFTYNLGATAASIEELDFVSCDLAAESAQNLARLLAACPKLRKVGLAFNRRLFDRNSLEEFCAGLGDPGLPQLEELELEYCDLEADAGTALGGLLAKCPKLSYLGLHQNKRLFTPEGLKALWAGIGCGGLPQLSQISCAYCDIPPESAEGLCSLFQKCPGLRRAGLNGNWALLGSAASQAVFAAAGLQRLLPPGVSS